MTPPSRASGGAVRHGAPAVGRTVPGWTVAVLGVVAGVAGALVAVGQSGWLVVAFVVTVAAAVFPRGPFAVLLVVQIAVAGANADDLGAWQVAAVIGTTHLVLAVSFLAGWVPRAARVQLRALRRPAIRFAAVDAFAQVVGAVVIALGAGTAGGPVGVGVWVGVAGGVALLVLAVWLLVPALRSSSADR